MATTISTPRSRHTPTRASGRTPARTRWCARRLARAFSAPYVSDASPYATASASGARAAWASKRAGMDASAGYGAAVRFHSSTTRRRSSGPASSRADMRTSGSTPTRSSTRWKWAIIRSMVSGSNRSVAYSSTPPSPSSRMFRASVMSNLLVPVSGSSGRASMSPASSSSVAWMASRAKITWNRGVCRSDRSGRSSATSRSKGSSWWAYAPRAVARTRRSTSRNAGSPDRSVRSTTVLTKNPTSFSSSRRLRPATGLPMTTSSVPAYFDSST